MPAPIASLTTTLVPLFVMMLAALTLGERLTARRMVGFGVAAVGMVSGVAAVLAAVRTPLLGALRSG